MDEILIIVEGAKTETKFFKRLTQFKENTVYTVSYNNNIYNLYECLKSDESDDTIRMLIYGENNNISNEDKKLLKEKKNVIQYIYLVFDFDYQNCKHLKNIEEELNKILNLTEYFSNEADMKGKLLINYPMMESYKDLSEFDDLSYLDAFIQTDFETLSHYKKDVSKRGIKKDILSYREYDFFEIAKLNLKKINKLLFNNDKIPTKDQYFRTENFSQLNIYKKQLELLKNDKKIAIINSAILIFVDLYPKMLKNISKGKKNYSKQETSNKNDRN